MKRRTFLLSTLATALLAPLARCFGRLPRLTEHVDFRPGATYVILGEPRTGKTTLVNRLRKRFPQAFFVELEMFSHTVIYEYHHGKFLLGRDAGAAGPTEILAQQRAAASLVLTEAEAILCPYVQRPLSPDKLLRRWADGQRRTVPVDGRGLYLLKNRSGQARCDVDFWHI